MTDSTAIADQADMDTHHQDDRSRLIRILQTPDADFHSLSDADRRHLGAVHRSTSPGQYWHCDTIEITGAWQGFTEVLVMVDDFSRKVFVYAMKNKRQEQVVSTLKHHFLREATTPTGVNFYTERTTLRSDQGSEFVNASVQAFCDDIGCIQEFSCPGGGKWQNGVAEQQIRDLKATGRSLIETSHLPEVTNMFALYQPADILNILPTSSNAGGQDSSGLSPNFVYSGHVPDIKN